MIFGMRYSPASSLSVSQRMVSAVFMAEFQLMLAMNRKSTSIGAGSAAQALRMTVCSMPCTASG